MYLKNKTARLKRDMYERSITKSCTQPECQVQRNKNHLIRNESKELTESISDCCFVAERNQFQFECGFFSPDISESNSYVDVRMKQKSLEIPDLQTKILCRANDLPFQKCKMINENI